MFCYSGRNIYFCHMIYDTHDFFNIDAPRAEVVEGAQLVAAPLLTDRWFQRSVVQILEHNHEGTIGLVMNQMFHVRASDLVTDLENGDKFPVYRGGPVGRNQLFLLHTLPPELAPESRYVGNGMYLGADVEAFRQLLANHEIFPNQIRFVVGYSGWEEGQLAAEIADGAWAVVNPPIPSAAMMTTLPSRLYAEALDRLGPDYATWRLVPERAIFN